MVDFKSVLKQKKEIIWPEVQKYLPKEGPYDFVEVVNEYSIRQGKYGRGTLILLSCEAFGGDPSKAVRTAAAMQMSEDWLLMHDDWEDNSDERRGKPALHKIYLPEIAINAGDALHMYMWKALIENREILDEETTRRVLNEFSRFLDITARGQHLEMSLMYTNKKGLEELEYQDYEDIIYGKAAEYTIAGPLRLGAIIAGQSDEVIEKISEVGIPMGKGFQVRDDLLNIVGEGSVYGKEIGGDIFEGKRTVLVIHLIKNTEGEEHQKVLDIMNKPRAEKTTEEVEWMIKMMKEKGSVQYAEDMAKKFSAEAKIKFNEYFPDLPNREIFEAAVDFFTMDRKV
ncbi:MAG: polyprenyl synthetase family protein [Candidatus Aenigmarchaeota archaeon]|nr:polyprenyl synthetase family protein [Candidatus Aenigmarchaeota archaeon]